MGSTTSRTGGRVRVEAPIGNRYFCLDQGWVIVQELPDEDKVYFRSAEVGLWAVRAVETLELSPHTFHLPGEAKPREPGRYEVRVPVEEQLFTRDGDGEDRLNTLGAIEENDLVDLQPSEDGFRALTEAVEAYYRVGGHGHLPEWAFFNSGASVVRINSYAGEFTGDAAVRDLEFLVQYAKGINGFGEIQLMIEGMKRAHNDGENIASSFEPLRRATFLQ